MNAEPPTARFQMEHHPRRPGYAKRYAFLLMTEPEKYTPLSERLQQDVWHDNFVPRYSAIASATPSRLVLTGVWLIFAPMAFASVLGIVAFANSPNLETAVISLVPAILFFPLSVAVLYTQTRRFCKFQDVCKSGNDDVSL